MVATLLAGRYSLRRVGVLVQHNITATRFGTRYWIFMLAALFEPLFYLLSFGVGVGHLVDRAVYYGGRPVAYSMFVAPGMLAVSAMSSVLVIAVFGFFGKLKHSRVLEVVFATPVKAFEIAVGELVWALTRAAIFSAAFLAVMVALRLTTIGWALVALPATVLVGAAFGAVGMSLTTLLRGWQDFDSVIMIQTALMLFSGTFFPIATYPEALRVFIEVTPLYQAIELLRGLTLGQLHPALAGHTAYLAVMTLIGLVVARRRIERHLRG
jgi:lipooligosaccharide transport system permease protein